jgi:peroxiredoxin Q/BCP
MPLEPGDTAPDFTLPDQSGEPVSLASFKGRKVLVYFYPRADTADRTMCIRQKVLVRG